MRGDNRIGTTATINIPVRPEPELHLWELQPPCGYCESCQVRARVEYTVTFMNAHFARATENLDPRCPGYLRAVDRLCAERDREVERLRSGIPYCDRAVVIEVSP